MEITIETITRNYPIVIKLGFGSLDAATRAIFEMYARNVCQQLEWNNGSTATDYAAQGAKKLLALRTPAGTVGAAILFGIGIRQQLDWNNGSYATEVATGAGRLILSQDPQGGVEVCQKLFNMCVNQQLAWGNGAYASEITDTFTDLIARCAG